VADEQRNATRLPNVAAGSGFWLGLSRASRHLLILGAILLLSMMVMVAIAIDNLWAEAMRDASYDIDRLGLAVGEQTDRSFQEVDLVVLLLRNMIEAKQTAAFTGESALSLSPIDLSSKVFTLPEGSSFAIINADGKMISHTASWPPRAQMDHPPDFIDYFRQHNDADLFLDKPFFDTATKTWFVYLARRFENPHGDFMGAVVGVVELDDLSRAFRRIIGKSSIAIYLFRRDGIVLTSDPHFLTIGRRPARLREQWNQIVASGHSGQFLALSLVGSTTRIISVTPLRDYPLVVNVSISQGEALQGWRKQIILTVTGAVCATLCMILLLRAIMLQLRRLEQSEASLAGQSALLTTTLDNISDGVVMADAADRIVVCNRRAMALLDLPPSLMASRPAVATVFAYQRALGEFPSEAAADAFLKQLRARSVSTVERHRPNGTILEIRNQPLPDGGVIRTYTDITERRRSEAQIRFLAHHDPLTGLANRTLFAEKLQREIDRADSHGHSLAVLYLDLDRFKFINDTRGHATGDRLLIEVAGRLSMISEAGGTIARMGGDEFAAILPLDKPERDPCITARALIQNVQSPIEIGISSLRIGLSVGIALYPGHARSVSDLLRNADSALYQAKTEGTGLCRIFDATMQARQALLFQREQDLRIALERKQFVLAYQPIVHTGDGHVVGCEALLRWHHPIHGPVPPADLVALAERIGLIVLIGHWVLETACREAASWPADTHVAVNLSPIQINDEGLVDEIRGILERTGLPPNRLTLEVTEGSLLEDNSTVRATMRALRGIGIRFSLDDFGTGHSGLGYLRRFPFDSIKIDKLFIQDMVEQPDAAAIVNALLAVSAELHLDVVAEGVETEAQFNALKERRCRLVQGHYTARPMTSAETRQFIATHRPATA
jgi:diguanylate cyclase (GGDEF)-like protein